MRKNSTFEEKRALFTLHHLLEFNLDDWKLRDQPDLKNFSEMTGVEVVQDLYQDQEQHIKVLKEIWESPFSECSDDRKERFRKAGISIHVENDRIKRASLHEISQGPSHTISQIKKKVDALNSGRYEHFATYGLYVFVDTTFIGPDFSSYVQQIIDEVMEYQRCKERQYNVLYLDQCYVLCICDLVRNKYDYKMIPLELRGKIAQEAEKWEG